MNNSGFDKCTYCNGHGTRIEVCPVCRGSGQTRNQAYHKRDCFACRGTGESLRVCPVCVGSGKVPHNNQSR
jgi:DnaJ-class molecular chaperone